MTFLSRLGQFFSGREKPVAAIQDPVLGSMAWDVEEEAWLGAHAGFRFSLAYDQKSAPTPELVQYARSSLVDPSWLNAGLATSKAAAPHTFGPSYAAEVTSLEFGRIHFYLRGGKGRVFAELEGGLSHRCWRIEYAGTACEGMGFDS